MRSGPGGSPVSVRPRAVPKSAAAERIADYMAAHGRDRLLRGVGMDHLRRLHAELAQRLLEVGRDRLVDV